MNVVATLYICDGKACEAPTYCALNGTGECRHTTKIEHAIHKDVDPMDEDLFARITVIGDDVQLWERYEGWPS